MCVYILISSSLGFQRVDRAKCLIKYVYMYIDWYVYTVVLYILSPHTFQILPPSANSHKIPKNQTERRRRRRLKCKQKNLYETPTEDHLCPTLFKLTLQELGIYHSSIYLLHAYPDIEKTHMYTSSSLPLFPSTSSVLLVDAILHYSEIPGCNALPPGIQSAEVVVVDLLLAVNVFTSDE